MSQIKAKYVFRYIAVGFFLFALLSPDTVYAQKSYTPSDDYVRQQILTNQYIAKFSYETWLVKARAAARKKNVHFRFGMLLDAYSRGQDYDPLATDTINRLYELAYAVQISENPDEVVQDFKFLLDRHAPNYDVVMAAIVLVRDNPFLGDINFLEWMGSGLERRLLQSGNGAVASSAYNIYTPGEEAFLFRYHGVKPIQTEVLATESAYYHIHLVEDLRTGKPSKIYVRLTDIMKKLETQKRMENPSYRYTPTLPENFAGNTEDRAE